MKTLFSKYWFDIYFNIFKPSKYLGLLLNMEKEDLLFIVDLDVDGQAKADVLAWFEWFEL